MTMTLQYDKRNVPTVRELFGNLYDSGLYL